jgi:hypothetical protein
MHQCVEEGDLRMVAWLVAHGAAEDMKAEDDASITPLNLAAMRRDLTMCRWLSSHGAPDVYKYDPFR